MSDEIDRIHDFDEALIARFWSKVDRRGPDECWPWVGHSAFLKGREMCRFYGAGREFLAHRFSAIIAYGPCPEGMETLHACDNPPCCNPAHLKWGTHHENIQQCYARKRRHIPFKDHCKKGHPFSGSNLILRPNSGRPSPKKVCRICRNESARRSRIKMKAVRARLIKQNGGEG